MEKGGLKAKAPEIEARARRLAEPVISERGFTLWDVCFEKEGAMWYLRILFDKEGGITSDECEEITEPLNKLMDKESFIQYVDILDIGSPGLTKKLRSPEHFRSCMGQPLKISRKDEQNKTVITDGTLAAYNEESGEITLETNGGEIIINAGKCIKITTDF